MNGYCQFLENFYFKESQPKDEESISRLPANLRGLYMSDKDSTKRLLVNSDSVAIEIPMVQYGTRAELIKKKYKVLDTLVTKPNGISVPCFIKNDTVFFVDYVESVFFAVSETNQIKKVDDKYILSKKVSDDKWEVFLLYKENDKICLAYFDFEKFKKEIDANKKIEKVKQTESNSYYLANLKLKEFNKIIDKGYFPIKQYFHNRFDF